MYFRIKTFLGGKAGKRTHTRKQARIYWLLNNVEWDEVWIQVQYGDTGFNNEGWYTDVDEAKGALSAWCEPWLIEYAGVA